MAEPVKEPILKGNTNRDLVRYVTELISSLKIANTRLDAINKVKINYDSPSE